MATVIVPIWESSTWWGLAVPDFAHLANEVGDWVWLDMSDPDLFVPGSAPGGRAVVPPDGPLLAIRVDFSEAGAHRRIPLFDRCLKGGCGACRSTARHRQRLGAKLRMGVPRCEPSGPRGGRVGGGLASVSPLPRGGIHL